MDKETLDLITTIGWVIAFSFFVMAFLEMMDRRLYGYLLQFWKYHIEKDGQKQTMHPQTFRPLKDYYDKLLEHRRSLHEAALVRLVLNGAIVYKHKWTGKQNHKYRWKINRHLTFKSEIPPIPWSLHWESIKNWMTTIPADLKAYQRRVRQSWKTKPDTQKVS